MKADLIVRYAIDQYDHGFAMSLYQRVTLLRTMTSRVRPHWRDIVLLLLFLLWGWVLRSNVGQAIDYCIQTSRMVRMYPTKVNVRLGSVNCEYGSEDRPISERPKDW
jgi:hypothetical protein